MKDSFENYSFPVEYENFDAPVRDPRDIRLLIVDAKTNTVTHDFFSNLGRYLNDNDLLIFNDVGISPSRLIARSESGQELDLCFLMTDREDPQQWELIVLAHDTAPTSGRFSAYNGKLSGELMGKTRDFDGGYWVERDKFDGYRGLAHVDQSPELVRQLLDSDGTYMHPWYADLNALDRSRLNPTMTRKSGGVLLSEPSRRIGPEMLSAFEARGMESQFVSLWMSFSWNQATPDTDLDNYAMNEEEFEVSQETVDAVLRAKSEKRRVVSVGTSGARCLESLGSPPKACAGRTDLFIRPGFTLRYCDVLLTNLHNSMGTHVIMASAFANTELVMDACRQAVERDYYFGIHGDSMLVLPSDH